MKLEDQVVSLELAKKMKELGFEQDSNFWYGLITGDLYLRSNNPNIYFNINENQSCYLPQIQHDNPHGFISAPTIAEVGEMLPPGIASGKCFHIEINRFWCEDLKNHKDYLKEKFDTEIEARVKMLIWLKENGLLGG